MMMVPVLLLGWPFPGQGRRGAHEGHDKAVVVVPVWWVYVWCVS